MRNLWFEDWNSGFVFFPVKIRKMEAFKWSRMMSLNLDGDIYLKPSQIYEFVRHAYCLSALEMSVLPGSSKLPGEGNYRQVAPVALREPGSTASRHWDMSGFSPPCRLQAIACVSLTGNSSPHTAVLGTWATLKGSALTGCHIFSPELAVSNLSFRTSALGHFHSDFTLVLTPLSLKNLKFSATPANVLYDQRAHTAVPQTSHRDIWVGGSQVVTWGTGYYRSCSELKLTCKRHMWWGG